MGVKWSLNPNLALETEALGKILEWERENTIRLHVPVPGAPNTTPWEGKQEVNIWGLVYTSLPRSPVAETAAKVGAMELASWFFQIPF